MDLTYGTSQLLSQPILKVLRTHTLAFNWAKPSTQSLFYNKVYNISSNLWNAALNVKIGWLYGYRMTELCRLLTLMTVWLSESCGSLLLPSISRERYHIRSKFKVWFLLSVNHFHKIIKLKNHSVEPSYVRYCMYIPRPAPGSYFHSPTG